MACSMNSCATKGAFGECLPNIYCPPPARPAAPPTASPPPTVAAGDPLKVLTDANGVPLWPDDGTVYRMLMDAPAAAPATYQARFGQYDVNERRLDAVHQRELDQWDTNEGEFSQQRQRLSAARQYQLNQVNAELTNAQTTHQHMISSYAASTDAYVKGQNTNASVTKHANTTTGSLQAEVSPIGTTGGVCRHLTDVKARIDSNNAMVRAQLGNTFLQKQSLLPLPSIIAPDSCSVG